MRLPLSLVALPAVSVVSLAGCAPQERVVQTAGTGAVRSPVLVLPTRVCVEYQADNMRHRRAGERGLVTTAEVVDVLGDAVPGQRERGTTMPDDCGPTVDLEDPASSLAAFVASRDVLRQMRAAGAKTALVTEIETRLVCATGRSGLVTRSHCFEDDIKLTVLVVDDRGQLVRVATSHVASGDEAKPVVRAVLPPAPASAQPAANCKLAGQMLDCT